MKIETKKLVILAFLLGLEVILSRFLSISTPIIKIGFAFVPIVLCAMLYGPLWAGIVAAVGDILGMLLFPTGVYFPGFTFSAFLSGIIYGVFLYKKPCSLGKLVLLVFIIRVGIGLFLTTYWLTFLTKLDFSTLFMARLGQGAFLFVLEIVIIRVMEKKLRTLMES